MTNEENKKFGEMLREMATEMIRQSESMNAGKSEFSLILAGNEQWEVYFGVRLKEQEDDDEEEFDED